MFRTKSAVLALLIGLAPLALAATPPDAAKTPVLMELFTSEGCSSCPPVDTWVEQLDRAQPVRGAELIVLSEHVDYWDQDGWLDPYSSAQLSDRQREYVRDLGLSDVYTPQIILDGKQELHPADLQWARRTLESAANAPMMAMHIGNAQFDKGGLTVRVTADGAGQKHGGDVFLAVALDKAVTDVLAGENNGKKLTNVAVVKQLVKIGKLQKGKPFDMTFFVKLWPDADPANMRVIAFVQESGQGKIVGAAMTKDVRTAEQPSTRTSASEVRPNNLSR
jgi:hypothetical protein